MAEAAASNTPTPSAHVSEADDDSNSEADDDASASEPDAFLASAAAFDEFMHRMAYNKELGESSDDEPGKTPVKLLAAGGAKPAQLGAKQRDLLNERARQQSAAVEESARRAASEPVAAAAAAPFDAKAAFRVRSQPATMDFSDIGMPAAAEPSPGSLRAARAMASGVASATFSLGKSFLQSGSGVGTAAQQPAFSMVA